MCFGGSQTSTQNKTETQTQTPPEWLTNAAQSNLNFAQNMQNQPFQPYTGSQVANFGPLQQQSFDAASQITPFVGQAGSLISNYANAGPQRVSANTIASQMSPYMNQYVNLALQPQLQMQDVQFANQNKGVDAAATMAGAFGDTGWGQLRGTTTQAQDAARAGLVGSAYNAAFNAAIAGGAQDVAFGLNRDTTNAQMAETALQRQLTGAGALTGANNQLNALGQQQTAQGQAGLNALYNQWLMSQQYPFQTAQLANQTLGAARTGAPITTTGTTTGTTTAPNNSGFGMLGTALGIAAAPFTGGASLAGMLPSLFGNSSGYSASGDQTGNYFPGNSATYGAGYGPNPNGGGYAPMFGAADGGAIPAGAPTMVGERGPELFIPGGRGVVVPAEILEAARKIRAKKLAKGQHGGISAQLGMVA